MLVNYNKKKIFEFYLISSYLLIILSLGANLAYIEHINFEGEIFKVENINNLRGLSPLLILITNIFIIFKSKKHLKIHEYFLICLTLSYLFGVLVNETENINLFTLHFIIAPLALITTLAISREVKKLCNELIFFYVLLFFLIIVVFLFYSQNKIQYGGGYISFFDSPIIFINSNGISRIVCVLNFFLMCSFIRNKNYLNFKSIFISMLSIFFSSMIILSEGRVNITIMLVTTLLLFLNNKINFIKKTIFFFLIIFSSFFIAFTIPKTNLKISNTTFERFQHLNNVLFSNESHGLLPNLDKKKSVQENIFLFIKQDEFITKQRGRFSKWIELVKYSLNLDFKTTLLGRGPETDRKILTDLGYQWNADSANGFLYSFISGGLIGIFFYLGLIIILLNNLKFFKTNIEYLLDKSLFNIFFSIFPILLLLRSFLENSMASWSLDFIIISTCLHYFNFKRN